MEIIIHKKGWLSATGQLWKLKLATVLAVLSFISLILMILGVNAPENIILRITGMTEELACTWFMLFAFLLFLLLFWSVKCPDCKKCIGYHVAKTADVNEWLSVLSRLAACPLCGSKKKVD